MKHVAVVLVRHDAENSFAQEERAENAGRSVEGARDIDPLASIKVSLALGDEDANVRAVKTKAHVVTWRMSTYRAISLKAHPIVTPIARRHCRSV